MEITNVGPEKESELAGENIDDQSYSFEFLGSKLEGHKDLDKLLSKWYQIFNISTYSFFI